MTSLSPELLGRYSATQLPDFITQIRKLLHLLGFRTRLVYQFYPWEVVSFGAGTFNHSLRHFKTVKNTSTHCCELSQVTSSVYFVAMGTMNVLYNGLTLWQLPVCYYASVENFILTGDTVKMMLLMIFITIINNV